MDKKFVKRLLVLRWILFSISILGLTLVEAYAQYYTFLGEIGWIMLIAGVVGVIFLLIHNKIKKIDFSAAAQEEKKKPWPWTISFILITLFFGLSIGFTKYGTGEMFFIIPKYVGGFLMAFLGMVLVALIIYHQFKKKRNQQK